MDKQLDDAMAQATAQLDEAGQRELSKLVSAFLAARGTRPHFTAVELAHLLTIDNEPFDRATPEEVEQTFRTIRA